MNSRLDELKQMYSKEITAAADVPPTVIVLDSNWRALIELNKQMSQEQLEILQKLSELSTKTGTEAFMKTVRSDQRATIMTCQELVNQMSETATLAVTKMENSAEQLRSQAGKLNEQYSSTLRELENYKRKLENVQVDNGIADSMDSIVGGIAAPVSIIDESDGKEYIDRHTDSKVLSEEEKRKESLGYHMG